MTKETIAMPDSSSNTRTQIVDLIEIVKQTSTAAEDRLNFLIQHQQKPSKEDITLVRKLRGLIRSLEQRTYEFFAVAKEMREGLEGENERLRQAFKVLKEEVDGL
ncbi:hypothetical protein KGQ34_03825, partial [Patescibacteria group bacterium]|nr:hypothetical protein [Patescibacteria group bacterium]